MCQARELFEGFSHEVFHSVVEHHRELPPPRELGALLAEVLDDNGKAAVFRYAMAIAVADQEIAPEEQRVLAELAQGLQLVGQEARAA